MNWLDPFDLGVIEFRPWLAAALERGERPDAARLRRVFAYKACVQFRRIEGLREHLPEDVYRLLVEHPVTEAPI